MRLILSPGELIRLKVWRCKRWFKRVALSGRGAGGRVRYISLQSERANSGFPLRARTHTLTHTIILRSSRTGTTCAVCFFDLSQEANGFCAFVGRKFLLVFVCASCVYEAWRWWQKTVSPWVDSRGWGKPGAVVRWVLYV